MPGAAAVIDISFPCSQRHSPGAVAAGHHMFPLAQRAIRLCSAIDVNVRACCVCSCCRKYSCHCQKLMPACPCSCELCEPTCSTSGCGGAHLESCLPVGGCGGGCRFPRPGGGEHCEMQGRFGGGDMAGACLTQGFEAPASTAAPFPHGWRPKHFGHFVSLLFHPLGFWGTPP